MERQHVCRKSKCGYTIRIEFHFKHVTRNSPPIALLQSKYLKPRPDLLALQVSVVLFDHHNRRSGKLGDVEQIQPAGNEIRDSGVPQGISASRLR